MARPTSSTDSPRETRRSTVLARRLVALLLAVCFTGPTLAGANDKLDRKNTKKNQVLVRAPAATIAELAAKHGLTIVAADEADGHLAVLEGPEGMAANSVERLLRSERGVASVSPATLASIPGVDGLVYASSSDVVADLLRADPFAGPCHPSQLENAAWGGYADQEAGTIVRLHEARLESGRCGAGVVVAVLDTGVDPSHPLLADALVAGADFLSSPSVEGLPSDWSNVDQSVRAIVEQSVRAIVEQSQVAVLGGGGEIQNEDQAMAPILAGDGAADALAGLPPAFGHGTMVAGLVRWVAPAAQIMPLRVFDGSGSGHVYDIVRAIYWAVDHGADVINMSFSSPAFDLELLRAVEYARAHGVVCIAAAGNQGQRTSVYPSSLANVVGVASSNDDDSLSLFSNWGSQVAALAAPGAGLITTYPGGLFAAGWGTSFAAPLVSGALALIRPDYPGRSSGDHRRQVIALLRGSRRIEGLASATVNGRLDVLGLIHEAH